MSFSYRTLRYSCYLSHPLTAAVTTLPISIARLAGSLTAVARPSFEAPYPLLAIFTLFPLLLPPSLTFLAVPPPYMHLVCQMLRLGTVGLDIAMCGPLW